MSETAASTNQQLFLTGGGEMGHLIRGFDWQSTNLGHTDNWPAILKNFTSLVLASPSPMMICWGANYIQLYNDAFRPILGNNKHPRALGISATETYAEIWETLKPLFKQVMNGEAVGNPEIRLSMDRGGYFEDTYFNFSYNPIKDEEGVIHGFLVVCIETTGQMKANKELDETQKNLHNLLNVLTESDFKFRSLIKDAPVAIALLNGHEILIESANDNILTIWGKQPDIVGKRLADALPELEGQPFLGLIGDVLKTGKPYTGSEVKAFLERKGILTEGYYNFTFQPIKDEQGNTTRVMIVAMDVTEQVGARNKLESTATTLKQAIESANIGTWSADLVTGILTVSPRSRATHGIPDGKTLTLEESMEMIEPEYRQMVADAIQAAVASGESFTADYIIAPMDGSSRKWLRATGKVNYEEGVARIISGTLMDITEQKKDDQRKNDFIGMVSHELKTPLTTLTAIVQVTNSKLKNSDDQFLAGAMEKANVQVKKMGTMINGFLNISRLESSQLQIDKQQFELQSLLEEVIRENQLTVSSHIINMDNCGSVVINADRDKISSVIYNLISNAIKYSPKEKSISVRCEVKQGQAEVSITDDGIGIKAEDLEKIFDRYFRVASNHTRHISGFGIGLYLSAEIIKRHDGKIWAESEPGTGSKFSFSIPIESPHK